jgi:hypothetical protein
VRSIILVRLALFIVAAFVPTLPAAAEARAPIVAHGHRIVPVVGDWEGTANGFPASFALVYNPRLAKHGRSAYGFQDMTLLEPGTCPVASFRYTEAVISARPALTPLAGVGRFPLENLGVSGAVTGSTSATLIAAYSFLAEPGASAGCSGRLVWSMHPVHRRSVADGTWRVTFGDGETSTFAVGAGGRLAVGISSPANAPGCNEQFGGADAFIGANGSAGFVEPNGFSLSMAFATTTATGTVAVGSHCEVTFTASLSKRAK